MSFENWKKNNLVPANKETFILMLVSTRMYCEFYVKRRRPKSA